MADLREREIEQIINQFKGESDNTHEKSVEDVIMEIRAGIFTGTKEERRRAGRIYPYADEVSLEDVEVSYKQPKPSKRSKSSNVYSNSSAEKDYSNKTQAFVSDIEDDTYQPKDRRIKSRLYSRVSKLRLRKNYLAFTGKPLTHRQQFVKELSKTAENYKKNIINLIFMLLFSAFTWVVAFSDTIQSIIAQHAGGQAGVSIVWCAVLIAASLACADIFVRGFRDLRNPTPETLAAVTMIMCITEGAAGIFFPFGTSMYGAVACLSMCMIKYYEIQNYKIKAVNIKSYIDMKRPYVHEIISVTNKQDETREMTAKIPIKELTGHPEKIFQKSLAEKFYIKYVPLVIILGGIFATISVTVSREPQNAISAFTALLCMASFGAIAMSENIPFIKCQKRISHLGGAVIGRKALYEYSKSMVLSITDADLFPKGSVKLYGMKFYGHHKIDDVLMYTSKTISKIVPGISPSFSGIIERQTNIFEAPGELKYYNNGGVSIKFGYDNVLMGSLGFFASMGINVPMEVRTNFRNSEENAVLVAINSDFAGAFVLKYTPVKTIKTALALLIKKGIEINVVSKDFNMTPELIEKVYSLKDGYVRVSPIAESLNISDTYFDANNSRSYGVVQRESLPLFVRTFLAVRRAQASVSSNLIMTCAAAGVGTLILIYLFSKGATAQASGWNIFLYQLFWSAVLFLKPEFDR